MCDQCETGDHQRLYRSFRWKLISKRISDKRALKNLFRDVYKIVDKVNAELRKRFDEKSIVMVQGVTSLCPTSSSFLDEDQLVTFAKLFNVNTDCLHCEIATFHHLLKCKDKNDHPKGLLQMLSNLESLKEAFSEQHHIVLIACTLPVSTTECERNFSLMKLIRMNSVQ